MDDAATPVFKKRGAKANARKAPPPPSSSGSSSESEGDEGRVIKRRKTTGKVISSSSADQKQSNGVEGTTQFAADRSANITANEDATKRTNWYEKEEADKDNLSSKNLLGSTRARPKDGAQQEKNAPPKPMGPTKAANNVRMITITDFAPDVCKDYKKTGFCGFGDSCKFLHAREDYAAGWKLDKEWEESGKGKKGGQVVGSANRTKDGPKTDDAADDALLEKIPFACIICKKPYTRPIITKCGHYFCEACALQRYRKTPTCAACGAGTNGVFNGAKKLNELLDKKRSREKQKRLEEKEKAREEGKEVSDGENEAETADA